jgi:hypothetical protein
MRILDGLLIIWNFSLVTITNIDVNILHTGLDSMLVIVSTIYTVIRITTFLQDHKNKNKK